MKILVLSDSHGSLEYMRQAVRKEQPELICHLGDCQWDGQQLRQEYWQIPFLSVPGNCDYPAPHVPLEYITEEQGIRILLTHGHKYGVKNGLLRLQLAAKEAQCQIALFGHTHVSYCEQVDGIWLLNPGTCHYHLRYGIVEISSGRNVCCYVTK